MAKRAWWCQTIPEGGWRSFATEEERNNFVASGQAVMPNKERLSTSRVGVMRTGPIDHRPRATTKEAMQARRREDAAIAAAKAAAGDVVEIVGVEAEPPIRVPPPVRARPSNWDESIPSVEESRSFFGLKPSR